MPPVHTPAEEKQTKRDLENRGKSGQSEPHSDTPESTHMTTPDLPDKIQIEKEETQRKEKETESQTGDRMRDSYQEPYDKTARYLGKERS